MFESVVAGLISKYLGDYLVGFDQHNLGLNLTKGNIDLHDIQVKPDALSQLQLPFTISYGRVGHLHLEIPWYSLTSSPVIVRLSQLYIVASPTSHIAVMDPVQALKKALELKRDQLEMADLMFDPELNHSDASPSSSSKSSSPSPSTEGKKAGFLERLASKIVSNVQVFIEDVHLRIEDDSSSYSHSMSSRVPLIAGLLIDRLVLQSTDASWLPLFVKDYQPVIYKCLNLERLSLYMSHTDASSFFCPPAASLSSPDHAGVNPGLAFDAFKRCGDAASLPLLIKPVTSTVHLSLTLRQERDRPRVALDWDLGALDLELSQAQYVSILQLVNFFENHRLRAKYHELRPNVPIVNNARLWWNFVLRALTREIRERKRRWSPGYIHLKTQQRRRYIELYKLKKLEPTARHTKQALVELQALEDELEYDEVIVFRTLAMDSIRRQKLEQAIAVAPSPQESGGGWRHSLSSWLWGAKSSAKTTPSVVVEQQVPSAAHLASQHHSDPSLSIASLQSPELVLFQLSIRLQRLSLSLVNQQAQFLDGILHDISLDFSLHPSEIFHLRADLRALNVRDQISRTNKLPLTIVSNRDLTAEEISASGSTLPDAPSHFLSFRLDAKPPNSLAALSVALQSQPLFVLLTPKCLNAIITFFTSISDTELPELKHLAEVNMVYWTNAATAMFAGAVENPKLIDVDIQLAAPVVILPALDRQDSLGLKVHMGDFKFKTDTSSWDVSSASTLMAEYNAQASSSLAKFYEKYDISIQNIFVDLVVVDSLTFLPTLQQPADLRLLDHIDLQFSLHLCRIPVQQLPKVKLLGVLPELSLHLSPEHIRPVCHVLFGLIEDGVPKRDRPPSPAAARSSPSSSAPLNPELTPLLSHPNLFELAFSLGNLTVDLDRNGSGFLSLRLTELNLGFAEHSEKRTLSLTMGKLMLSDTRCPPDSPDALLLGTPQDHDMLSFRYIGVPKTSVLYKNIDHTILLLVSALFITINPPILSDLVETLQEIQTIITSAAKPPPPASPSTPLLASSATPLLTQSSTPLLASSSTPLLTQSSTPNVPTTAAVPIKTDTPVDPPSISIKCELEVLTLTLTKPTVGPIIQVLLSQIHFSMAGVLPQAFVASCSLKSLECHHKSLLHQNPMRSHSEKWSHILKSQGDKLIDLNFEAFMPSDSRYQISGSNPPVHRNAILQIRLGTLRAIFTTRLFAELNEFFSELHSGVTQVLQQTARMASDSLTDTINLNQSHSGNATTIVASLNSFFLIIPQEVGSPATPYLVLEAGKILVNNEMTTSFVENLTHSEFNISLSTVEIKTFFPENIGGRTSIKSRPILLPFELQTRVSIPLFPVRETKITVDVVLLNFQLSLDPSQIALVTTSTINGINKLRAFSPAPEATVITPAKPNTPPVLVTVSVQIPNFSIKLGTDSLSKVFTMEFEQLQSLLSIDTNTTVSASLRSLKLLYATPETILPLPLVLGSSSDALPFLGFSCLQSSNNLELSLQIENLFCAVLPEPIVDGILEFLLPLVNDLNAQFSTGLIKPEAPVAEGSSVDPAPGLSLMLRFNIARLRASVLDALDQEERLAISLLTSITSTLQLSPSGMTLAMQLPGLSLSSESIQYPPQAAIEYQRILAPVNISFELVQVPQKLSLTASVPLLDFSVSYTSIKLGKCLAAAWLPRLKPPSKPLVETASEPTTSLVAAAPPLNIIADIQITKLTACLVNDAPPLTKFPTTVLQPNSPLLRFSIENLGFHHTFKPPIFATSLQLDSLSADFYNHQQDFWEPFIESWDFLLGIGPLHGSAHGVGLSLNASKILDINVTPLLLQSAVECSDTWLDDLMNDVYPSRSDTSLTSKYSSESYFFENFSGLPVNLLIGTAPGGGHPVASGQVISLDESIAALPLFADGKIDHNLIKLGFEIRVDNFLAPVTNIPLAHYQSFPIFVPVSPSRTQSKRAELRLFWETHIMQGCRYLRLTSLVLLKNKSVHPIQVKILMPQTKERQKPSKNTPSETVEQLVLPPDQEFYVPALFLDYGHVQIRPMGNHYDWSSHSVSFIELLQTRKQAIQKLEALADENQDDDIQVSNPTSADDTGSERKDEAIPLPLLECPSMNANLPPHLYCSYLEDPAFNRRANWVNRQSLIFYDPIIIENRLITKMEFRFVQHKNEVIVFGPYFLPRAENISVSTFRPNETVNLQIRIKGYSWSQPVAITGKHVGSDLVIRDNIGRPLKLCVDNQTFDLKLGVRRITIFAPTWIINRSGLNLHYRRPRGLLRSDVDAAGQEATSHLPETMIISEDTLSINAEHSTDSSNSSSNLDWFVDCPRQRSLQARPFMFSGGKLSIQVKNFSSWSKPIGLPKTHSSAVQTALVLPITCDENSTSSQQLFELSIALTPGPASFWRTQLVTIESHIVLINNTENPLVFAQFGNPIEFNAPPHSVIPFHWPMGSIPEAQRLLCLKQDCYEWSCGVPVDAAQRFQVKLRPTSPEDPPLVLKVNILADQSTLSVLVDNDPDEFPEYLIDNQTTLPIYFRQSSTESQFQWTLLPAKASQVFIWDEPSFAKKKLQLRVGDDDVDQKFVNNPINLEKLRVFPPYFPLNNHPQRLAERPSMPLLSFILDTPEANLTSQSLTSAEGSSAAAASFAEVGVLIELVVENCSKILRLRNIQDVFQDLENHQSLRQKMEEYRQALHEQRALLHQSTPDTEISNPISQPSVDSKVLDVSLNLAGIGISVINQVPRELAYLRLQQISLQYIETFRRQSVEVKVKSLSIDNQLPLTPFPLLFRSCHTDEKPFFHASFIRSTLQQNVQFLHYVGLGLQEMDVMLDEIFLLELLAFSLSLLKYFQHRSGILAEKSILELSAQKDIRASTANQYDSLSLQKKKPLLFYFELLQLNSIKINLSFITVPGGHTRLDRFGPIFDFLLDLGGVIANVDRATLRLNGLMWKNPLVTLPDLTASLQQHYVTQVLRALGGLLGSADAFGNPKALVSGLGTGFKDFFVEPANGIVSSPLDFGVGIAKGTSSLFKNTVYSLSNTTQKLGETVGKALVAVAFDRDWQKKRERAQRKKAQHLGQGLYLGVKDLGSGIIDGAAGVLAEPIKGASRDGLTGFVAGVGRGTTGFFLKPTAGAVDFISRTAEGLRNTTTYFDENAERRVRNPRYFTLDGRLRPYDAEMALGQRAVLLLGGNFRHHKEIFLWWTPCNPDVNDKIHNTWFLVTDRTLFHLRGDPREDRFSVDIRWRVSMDRVVGFRDHDGQISVEMRNSSPHSARTGPSTHRLDTIKVLSYLLVEHDQVRRPYTRHDVVAVDSPEHALFLRQYSERAPVPTSSSVPPDSGAFVSLQLPAEATSTPKSTTPKIPRLEHIRLLSTQRTESTKKPLVDPQSLSLNGTDREDISLLGGQPKEKGCCSGMCNIL